MAKSAAKAGESKPKTKAEVISSLAESTGLAKKDIQNVFDALNELIKQELGKKGPGVFTLHGLLKLKVQTKPAQKARKGINPFTGEEQMFKAKPARKVVKATPLKNLKDMV
jgi:nucleoid DNA-binding protein